MRLSRSLVFILILLSVSCSSNKSVDDVPVTSTPGIRQEPSQSWAWEYSGTKGPDQWAKINSEYQLCASGQQQSPIDLRWKKPATSNPLTINYSTGDVIVSNTGYTIRLEFTPQSSITLHGQEYMLEKAEFRSPSEHYLAGYAMPVEIQFYHRSSNGLKQAILSIFAVAGRHSQWFENLWQVAMSTERYKTSQPLAMDPGTLIPPRKTFYQYSGSLTHPPCLEGVEWIVMNTPMEMSAQQITDLRGVYNNNNRNLQKLGSRQVINY